MKKILHVLNTNSFSGAENVSCQIILAMRNDLEWEAVYCSRDGEIRRALKERNIIFAPISGMSIRELRRVIKEQKPDIIHAHDMRASFFVSMACGNIPMVVHIHNNAFDSRRLSIKSILFLYAAKKAQHIFWVSQSAFNGYIFHRFFANKSSVLHNIIDADALKSKMCLDKETYDYDIVYLGRLTFPKNPLRLIDVLEKIVNKRPSTKVALIGTGELEDETRQYVCSKGLTESITFLGFLENPYKIMHDAKLMLMTSRWEGTPMCALEAMALGVPIVSTPTDGLVELITDGITGVLSDDDDELAEACCRILDDSSKQKEMATSACYLAALTDPAAYKNKVLAVYEKCISK